MNILDALELTELQKRAAGEPERDVLLTAGAGSGKTRTLVARYLWLMGHGFGPRQIVAITFTEKAAREMRNRVRAAVRDQARIAQGEVQVRWEELEARMDSARIGTIHSLCAEILRAHPAQSGLDPTFEVLEEGAQRALKAEVVEEALAQAADDPELVDLFSLLTTRALRRTLERLLDRRLELREFLDDRGLRPLDRSSALEAALESFLDDPAVTGAVVEMRALLSRGELLVDAGETLAPQIEGLLAAWDRLEELRQRGEWQRLAGELFDARRELMGLHAGKHDSRAKEALSELRQTYKKRVDPWLGGGTSRDEPPDPDLEARLPELSDRLAQLAKRLVQAYERRLERRKAVDFDDLEAGAIRLLEDSEVRARWREEVARVLVDEFQDTNARQRQIVEGLAPLGEGRLFVVGDARQSIYRFRGADVTVFRALAGEVEAEGGLVINLDETFRAHPELLRGLDALIGPVMGESDGGPEYRVPYHTLQSAREGPRSGAQAPFVEMVLGGGDNAAEARQRAATALAQRMLELKRQGDLTDWGRAALLFRASTAFSDYENALESSGIPYVTVAGRGFYERPEIRDVLNCMRALADPADDLALAGFLRSPPIGLSDAAVTMLRRGPQGLRPLGRALRENLASIPEHERPRAEKARAILDELRPKVDRLPVADLLKELLDRLDYRAVLASAESRLWRNVDKLLQDALTSDLVRVHAFLEYVRTLRDVGAREGEAPAEAEGAVQLMTIHKAKGLEFDLVALADASRRAPGWKEPVYLRGDSGLAVRPDRVDADPLLYRLAMTRDAQESGAEEDRLLYVAATRARERLLINGHLTHRSKGWKADGVLKEILEQSGVEEDGLAPGADPAFRTISAGGSLRVWFAALDLEVEPEPAAKEEWPIGTGRPLVGDVARPPAEEADREWDEEPERSWRATAVRAYAPAAAVGRMVHAAAARRLPAGTDEVRQVLEAAALREGLVDPKQRNKGIEEADRLLARLQEHRIWRELESARVAHREVPYTWRPPGGPPPDSGIIDVLYLVDEDWRLVDFKTDEIRSPDDRQEAVRRYTPQIQRYRSAARSLLGRPVQGSLVFLDDQGEVTEEAIS